MIHWMLHNMLDQIYWQVPNRIMVMQFSGELSFVEFKTSIMQAQTKLRETALASDLQIHVINDLTRTSATTSQWMEFSQVNRFIKSLPEQLITGWLVIVDSHPNPMMTFITSVVSQISKVRFRVVGSMDEAVEFLTKVDTTLAIHQPIIGDQQ
jgi:hypothetical protein